MTHSNDDTPLKQTLSSRSQGGKSASHPHVGEGRGRKRRNQRDSPEANFVARCEPRNPQAPFTSAGLCLHVGQLIRRNDREEIWDAVIVRCDEQTDGTLVVRVIVSNPDWEERVQIACIQSRPGDSTSMTALACNLDHEELPD